MVFIIAILSFVCIAIPLAFAWRLWLLDEPSLAAWLLVAADAAALVALVMLLGRWDIAGYYTRFALLAVFLAALLWSLRQHARRPWRIEGRALVKERGTTLASLLLFGAALAYVMTGMVPREPARAFAFPLTDGRFVIGQGGGIALLNHHAGHRQQRYAADIGAIGPAGFRATGILPRDLRRYAIYGTDIVSPCDGAVVATRVGLPDLTPPKADRGNAKGNHVVIDCGGVNVELAHLQSGSVAVTPGEKLAAGDPVGKVGNSGNTTEPHLHIHAVNPGNGTGVPMTFGARHPVRNRLFAR